jgi:hypothetical protein
MLHDVVIRAVPGDFPRKWMFDDYFDLYLWYQPDGTVFGFQLCYDKDRDQRALTWDRAGKFQHNRVDAGEAKPNANQTPILSEPCPFSREPVRSEFVKRAVHLEPAIVALILSKIDAFPSAASP